MARPKKQKSNEIIHQSNGAISTPKSVYDILGMKDTNYKHNTLAEYRTFLDNMNLAELQRHAVEIANIIPIDDRRRLVDRLEKEFCRTNARFAPSAQNQITIPKENQENIKKILNGIY